MIVDQLVAVYARGRGVAWVRVSGRQCLKRFAAVSHHSMLCFGGNECLVLKEPEQWVLTSTPLTYMRSDTCTAMCIVAIYLAKDWTRSVQNDLME